MRVLGAPGLMACSYWNGIPAPTIRRTGDVDAGQCHSDWRRVEAGGAGGWADRFCDAAARLGIAISPSGGFRDPAWACAGGGADRAGGFAAGFGDVGGVGSVGWVYVGGVRGELDGWAAARTRRERDGYTRIGLAQRMNR